MGTEPGVVINSVANPVLSWEKTNQLDVGVDFGFLNERITGAFAYFNRKSDNLLFYRPLPSSSGVESIADNIGGVKNVGWEFEITSQNIKRENLSWSTSFNITKLRNEITEVAPGTTQVVGFSWYDYYIREYAGIDPQDGIGMFYMDDENGNKVTTKDYNKATLYNIGNRLQDYTGGIRSDLKYRNFDFSVLASFGIGGDFYDGNYQSLMGGIRGLGANASTDLLDSWRASNANTTDLPILRTVENYANSASTRFLYDHTFLRVRNITVGYNFSPSILEQVKLRNARIYFNVQNPFTFFPNAPVGVDPDSGLNSQASNHNTTPNKFVSFGINIGI
jgi:hypothetical protein